MRILVCDDERLWRKKIKEYVLSNLDEDSESIVETFSSGKALIKFCLENKPDVLFLDIELSDINGLDLAKKLRKEYPKIIIVFITNHPNYVFSCFEIEPLNFLRKPIEQREFEKTFQRVINKYIELHKCISIKWQNDTVNLEVSDICYVEGYNRHLIFRLYNGECYEIVGRINEMYKVLQVYGFVKSHQGFIVNMLHIKSFGENEIYMKNGDSVLMSVRKRLKTKEVYADYINGSFK